MTFQAKGNQCFGITVSSRATVGGIRRSKCIVRFAMVWRWLLSITLIATVMAPGTPPPTLAPTPPTSRSLVPPTASNVVHIGRVMTVSWHALPTYVVNDSWWINESSLVIKNVVLTNGSQLVFNFSSLYSADGGVLTPLLLPGALLASNGAPLLSVVIVGWTVEAGCSVAFVGLQAQLQSAALSLPYSARQEWMTIALQVSGSNFFGVCGLQLADGGFPAPQTNLLMYNNTFSFNGLQTSDVPQAGGNRGGASGAREPTCSDAMMAIDSLSMCDISFLTLTNLTFRATLISNPLANGAWLSMLRFSGNNCNSAFAAKFANASKLYLLNSSLTSDDGALGVPMANVLFEGNVQFSQQSLFDFAFLSANCTSLQHCANVRFANASFLNVTSGSTLVLYFNDLYAFSATQYAANLAVRASEIFVVDAAFSLVFLELWAGGAVPKNVWFDDVRRLSMDAASLLLRFSNVTAFQVGSSNMDPLILSEWRSPVNVDWSVTTCDAAASSGFGVKASTLSVVGEYYTAINVQLQGTSMTLSAASSFAIKDSTLLVDGIYSSATNVQVFVDTVLASDRASVGVAHSAVQATSLWSAFNVDVVANLLLSGGSVFGTQNSTLVITHRPNTAGTTSVCVYLRGRNVTDVRSALITSGSSLEFSNSVLACRTPFSGACVNVYLVYINFTFDHGALFNVSRSVFRALSTSTQIAVNVVFTRGLVVMRSSSTMKFDNVSAGAETTTGPAFNVVAYVNPFLLDGPGTMLSFEGCALQSAGSSYSGNWWTAVSTFTVTGSASIRFRRSMFSVDSLRTAANFLLDGAALLVQNGSVVELSDLTIYLIVYDDVQNVYLNSHTGNIVWESVSRLTVAVSPRLVLSQRSALILRRNQLSAEKIDGPCNLTTNIAFFNMSISVADRSTILVDSSSLTLTNQPIVLSCGAEAIRALDGLSIVNVLLSDTSLLNVSDNSNLTFSSSSMLSQGANTAAANIAALSNSSIFVTDSSAVYVTNSFLTVEVTVWLFSAMSFVLSETSLAVTNRSSLDVTSTTIVAVQRGAFTFAARGFGYAVAASAVAVINLSTVVVSNASSLRWVSVNMSCSGYAFDVMLVTASLSLAQESTLKVDQCSLNTMGQFYGSNVYASSITLILNDSSTVLLRNTSFFASRFAMDVPVSGGEILTNVYSSSVVMFLRELSTVKIVASTFLVVGAFSGYNIFVYHQGAMEGASQMILDMNNFTCVAADASSSYCSNIAFSVNFFNLAGQSVLSLTNSILVAAADQTRNIGSSGIPRSTVVDSAILLANLTMTAVSPGYSAANVAFYLPGLVYQMFLRFQNSTLSILSSHLVARSINGTCQNVVLRFTPLVLDGKSTVTIQDTVMMASSDSANAVGFVLHANVAILGVRWTIANGSAILFQNVTMDAFAQVSSYNVLFDSQGTLVNLWHDLLLSNALFAVQDCRWTTVSGSGTAASVAFNRSLVVNLTNRAGISFARTVLVAAARGSGLAASNFVVDQHCSLSLSASSAISVGRSNWTARSSGQCSVVPWVVGGTANIQFLYSLVDIRDEQSRISLSTSTFDASVQSSYVDAATWLVRYTNFTVADGAEIAFVGVVANATGDNGVGSVCNVLVSSSLLTIANASQILLQGTSLNALDGVIANNVYFVDSLNAVRLVNRSSWRFTQCFLYARANSTTVGNLASQQRLFSVEESSVFAFDQCSLRTAGNDFVHALRFAAGGLFVISNRSALQVTGCDLWVEAANPNGYQTPALGVILRSAITVDGQSSITLKDSRIASMGTGGTAGVVIGRRSAVFSNRSTLELSNISLRMTTAPSSLSSPSNVITFAGIFFEGSVFVSNQSQFLVDRVVLHPASDFVDSLMSSIRSDAGVLLQQSSQLVVAQCTINCSRCIAFGLYSDSESVVQLVRNTWNCTRYCIDLSGELFFVPPAWILLDRSTVNVVNNTLRLSNVTQTTNVTSAFIALSNPANKSAPEARPTLIMDPNTSISFFGNALLATLPSLQAGRTVLPAPPTPVIWVPWLGSWSRGCTNDNSSNTSLPQAASAEPRCAQIAFDCTDSFQSIPFARHKLVSLLLYTLGVPNEYLTWSVAPKGVCSTESASTSMTKDTSASRSMSLSSSIHCRDHPRNLTSVAGLLMSASAAAADTWSVSSTVDNGSTRIATGFSLQKTTASPVPSTSTFRFTLRYPWNVRAPLIMAGAALARVESPRTTLTATALNATTVEFTLSFASQTSAYLGETYAITIPLSSIECSQLLDRAPPNALTLTLALQAARALVNPSTVTSIGSLGSSLSIAAVSPGGGAGFARLASLSAMFDCTTGDETADDGTSVTGMRFGDPREQYQRGAVVGNTVLLLGVSAGFLLLACVASIIGAVVYRTPLRHSMSYVTSILRVPSVFVIPLAVVLQPTVNAAIRLMILERIPGDRLLGVMGIVVQLAFVVPYLVVLYRTPCHYAPFSEEEQQRLRKAMVDRYPFHPATRRTIAALVWLLQPAGHWEADARRVTNAELWKARFLMLFDEFQVTWYPFGDLVASVALGTIAGVPITSKGSCVVQLALTSVIFLPLFIFSVAKLPAAYRLGNAFLIAGTLFGASSSVTLLIHAVFPTRASATVATLLLLLMAAVTSIKSLVDLLAALIRLPSLVVSIMTAVKPRSDSAGEGASSGPELTELMWSDDILSKSFRLSDWRSGSSQARQAATEIVQLLLGRVDDAIELLQATEVHPWWRGNGSLSTNNPSLRGGRNNNNASLSSTSRVSSDPTRVDALRHHHRHCQSPRAAPAAPQNNTLPPYATSFGSFAGASPLIQLWPIAQNAQESDDDDFDGAPPSPPSSSSLSTTVRLSNASISTPKRTSMKHSSFTPFDELSL